jgi:molybdopterin synthase sulfur carrier subunit
MTSAPQTPVVAASVAPAVTVSLRYFASIREAVGVSGEQWSTTAPTLAALRDELIARGGNWAEALARGRAVRVALNQVMCAESAALPAQAEVAFFPPVTGG